MIHFNLHLGVWRLKWRTLFMLSPLQHLFHHLETVGSQNDQVWLQKMLSFFLKCPLVFWEYCIVRNIPLVFFFKNINQFHLVFFGHIKIVEFRGRTVQSFSVEMSFSCQVNSLSSVVKFCKFYLQGWRGDLVLL